MVDVSAIARELNIDVYISTAIDISRAADGPKRLVDVTTIVERNATGAPNFDGVVATSQIIVRVQREVDRLQSKQLREHPFAAQPAFAAGMLWMAAMEFVSQIGNDLGLKEQP